MRGDYPAKADLLNAVQERYEQLRQQVAKASAQQMSQPNTSPRARAALPTTREMVAFILSGHMGVHLGQLSTWRRMIGLPPLF